MKFLSVTERRSTVIALSSLPDVTAHKTGISLPIMRLSPILTQVRLLCLNNEILEDNCHWNRQSDGSKICDKSCPDNTIFLTQNTHPAGDKTDCAHGSFIAVYCNDLQVLTSVCKNQYSADYILSGGLSGAGGSDFHFTRGGLKERSLSARSTHLKARAEEVKSGIRKEQLDETIDRRRRRRSGLKTDTTTPIPATLGSNTTSPSLPRTSAISPCTPMRSSWGLAARKLHGARHVPL
jgi:hypothetical protein